VLLLVLTVISSASIRFDKIDFLPLLLMFLASYLFHAGTLKMETCFSETTGCENVTFSMCLINHNVMKIYGRMEI
jgi:hypothetical protein